MLINNWFYYKVSWEIKFKRQKAKAEFKEGLPLDVCEDTADRTSVSGLDVNCKEREASNMTPGSLA